MRIVGHLEGHCITMGCVVCRQSFDLGCTGVMGEGDYAVSYDLYAGTGEHLGCVCYDCIQQPDAVMQWRLGTVELITRKWIADLDIMSGQAQ